MRRLPAAIAVFLCAAFVLTALPAQYARADLIYDDYFTMMPDAGSSSYYRIYPAATSPAPAYGAQIYNDTYFQQISYSNYASYRIGCSDFSNDSYDGYPGQAEMPANATINEIWVCIVFVGNRPPLTWEITANGTTTNSGYIAGGYGMARWDVTSLRDWDEEMMTNSSTTIGAILYTTPGITYTIDYLGYWFIEWEGWSGWEESEPDPPDEEGGAGANLNYTYVYNVTGLIGVFGLVGFAGMIAIPAGAMAIYRNDPGVGRVNLFVKMLILWVFCLSMFMLAVNGS